MVSSNNLIPSKKWGDLGDPRFKESVDSLFDRDACNWIDKESNKPKSCYLCPFVVWYRDYKRCPIAHQQLPNMFKNDARLKSCPIQILLP